MSVTLSHNNEVGGTTILDDGTVVHWSEGGSSSVIIHRNGRVERVLPYDAHPILTLPEIAGLKTTESRSMTEEEERQWEAQMGYQVDLESE